RRREVALLLLLGAELPDRRRGDVGVRADARGGSARADARELLAEHRLVQVVAALPAVLDRVLEPEQALGGELGEDLVGEPALLLPLRRVRRELAVDESAHGLAQLFVLVGKGRRERAHDTSHSRRRPCSAACRRATGRLPRSSSRRWST